MIKTKKQMFIVIGVFTLVMLLGTVTYAFFNYTRTGSANTVNTGRITFNTNQNSTLILTNIFPIASNEVGNDYTSDTLQIAVTGDTTYSEGVEYLVTAEEVDVETSTGKKVPLTLKVDVTDDLGTEDTDQDQVEYFTDRGSSTSYYKILSESVLYDGQYLLVGYIAPGATGIDGTINIKAYLDNTRVAISDTYPEGNVTHLEASSEVLDYTNGTTSNWVDGRTVLTTSEWNSLSSQGNELSFKVRIEANEGIWVDPAIPINSAGSIPSELKNNITEIYFIKETPIRMQERYNAASVKADMTDTTLNEGKVLAWQEGNKLYIASSGETYLPADCTGYLYNTPNVSKIEFENINTSRVTNMTGMFSGCSSLQSIDLTSFDTSSVTTMSGLFSECTGLKNVNLSGLGSNTLSMVGGMFNSGSSNIEELNLSNFNFGTASMRNMFSGMTAIKVIDLSSSNTSNVSDMSYMFSGNASVEKIDLSNQGGNNLTYISSMFAGCTGLKEINMNGFNFGTISNINSFFNNITNLEIVNLSNTNMSNMTQMNGLFSDLTNLKKVNMSDSGGNNLVGLSGLFTGCTGLKEIDMSGFNFGLVSMFNIQSLNSLETVDLRNANMSNMIYSSGMLGFNDNLKTIDLTGIVLSSSAQLNAMFYSCPSLTTIKVSSGTDWSSIYSHGNSAGMFYDCTSLVGGQGTTYDPDHIDSAYAKVDGGPNNKGYFTVGD